MVKQEMPRLDSGEMKILINTNRFLRYLWLGVFVMNLLVVAFAVHAIYFNLSSQVERAQTATGNLSTALEREIAGIFDSIDITLKTLVDRHTRLQQSGPLLGDEWSHDLRQTSAFLPILAGVRATDASGLVLYGLGKDDPRGASVSMRDYFVAHRDNPNAGLVISQPLQSKITRKRSIVLSRRLNMANGEFAGVVAATIPYERFTERFMSLKLGEKGSIGMRDRSMRLIVRYPALPDDGAIGSTRDANEFSAALEKNSNAGSYHVGPSSIDGVERYHGYSFNERYGFYINVGVAEDEYLARWRLESLQTLALVLVFMFSTVLIASQLHRAWIHQQRSAAQLKKSESNFHLLADAAPYGVALLDANGRFSYLNPALTKMLGYTIEDTPDAAILFEKAYPDPVYRESVLAAWNLLVAGAVSPDPVGRTLQVCRKDGVRRDIHFIVVKMNDGRITVTLEDITDRRQNEARVKTLLAEQNLIFDNVHVGILMTRNRRIIKCNRRQAEMFGYAGPEEIEGELTEIFYCSLEQFMDVGESQYGMMAIAGFAQGELEMRRKDGKRIWIMLTGRPLDPSAVLEGSIWVYADITERMRTEAELRIAAVAFESREGTLVTDAEGTILRVNQAFVKATGYTSEEMVGRNPRLLKSGRHSADFYREMWDSVRRTDGWQGEIWDRRKSGDEYLKWLTISAVRDVKGAVTHYIGTQLDITERKKAEEKIRELAFFDQLTGLPNRTLLADRLKQTMAASSRSGQYGALLFIDLDNFKTLNDTLGHDIGDQLLKQVSQRLMESVREGDTVARLGGDEFVVVLAGLAELPGEAASSVETVAEKVLDSLCQPYRLGNVHHRSTASIGVTLFRGDATTIDELMKQADLAMYKSKEAGRNLVGFFDPTLASAVKERAALESDLRHALDERQFLLHYQPQTSGGKLTGAEALVRWLHPQRGLVQPGEFIAVAEESELILPLGDWVLKTACMQLLEWAGRPEMANLTVSVNVSARQFRQPDFVDQVLAVLNSTGANPQLLKLELTETLLVANVQDIIEKMSALKARGVGFSLDDFGTGYSSLSYLKRMPLYQLKIDRSFVRDVLVDPNDAAIARTIVALGQSLGLVVIAEGVETVEQREFLAASGCQAYQGYLFSRPLPIAEFEKFARRDSFL
jgi:diguanylate cyclase (GGDEF)-like protein/PAS domain S-box-containing protein